MEEEEVVECVTRGRRNGEVCDSLKKKWFTQ